MVVLDDFLLDGGEADDDRGRLDAMRGAETQDSFEIGGVLFTWVGVEIRPVLEECVWSLGLHRRRPCVHEV